jgi:hypothetical protein
MSEKTDMVVSIGLVVLLAIVGLEIADYIRCSQSIEFKTPYFIINSYRN